MTNGQIPPLNFENFSMPGGILRRLKWVVPAVLLLVAIVLLTMVKGVYSDWLWFGELGFRGVYLKVLITRAVLFLVGFAAVIIVVGASVLFAYKVTAGPVTIDVPDALVNLTKRTIWIGALLAVIVLSVIMGTIFSSKWELFLRFTNAASFGLVDPMYGRDISFYVFALPTYAFTQGWIFSVFLMAIAATAIISFINFTVRGASFTLDPSLRNQIAILGALTILIAVLGLWIDRLQLVNSENGVVYGATYVDVNAKKHAYLVLSALGVIAAIGVVVGSYIGRTRMAIGIVGLWVILIVALGTGWPSLLQTFSVDPNEFAKENKYISRNIEFTRTGYGLQGINEIFYEAEGDVTAELVSDNLATIKNIRLWDYRPLTSV